MTSGWELRHKGSSHTGSGQRSEAVKHAALKTEKEIFCDICFKKKNDLHIKKCNFQKWNQARLNSTYNLLIKITKIKTETLLSLKEIENYIFSCNIIKQ